MHCDRKLEQSTNYNTVTLTIKKTGEGDREELVCET